ncbi:MAG: porin family protein [Bacteroidales bacterium]
MKHIFMIKKLLYRKLFLGALLFFISGTMFAQESESSGGGFLNNLKYGIKFGTTISEFTNQQPHTNSIQGITGGGFLNYVFNDKMALQLEASYFQQGGRVLDIYIPTYVGNDSWYSINIKNKEIVMHNIEVPVLFKYSIGISGFKLNGFIGPSFGYNLHTGVTKEGTIIDEYGGPHTYTGEENITNNMEKIQYSATAGIGIELPVSDKFYILIDARYRYGINSVYNGYSYLEVTEIQGDLKNNSMYFTLGLGLK